MDDSASSSHSPYNSPHKGRLSLLPSDIEDDLDLLDMTLLDDITEEPLENYTQIAEWIHSAVSDLDLDAFFGITEVVVPIHSARKSKCLPYLCVFDQPNRCLAHSLYREKL